MVGESRLRCYNDTMAGYQEQDGVRKLWYEGI